MYKNTPFGSSLIIIIIVFVVIVMTKVIQCHTDNTTTNDENFVYMNSDEFHTKQSRLLSFNTQDNGDISVELAFNVPFISIPIKKSIDMAKGAVANLNVGAVVLAGAIAIGFGIVIPGIMVFMSKKLMYNTYSHQSAYRDGNSTSRSDDSASGSQLWSILTQLDQALTENNMDTTSCMQRLVCWTVKNSAKKVIMGHSTSTDKLIDGFATSKWLHNMIDGTAVYSALQHGLNNTNCSQEYNQCRITQKSLQILAKQFVGAINKSRK